MKTLVISSRAEKFLLSDACAYDAEDVAIAALGADLMTARTDTATLARRYDLVLIFGVSFDRVREIKTQLLSTVRDRISGPVVAYIFGAYGALVRDTKHPLRQLIGPRKTAFSDFDRLYLGIGDEVAEIATCLNVETRYLPMAANVLGAAAQAYAGAPDRPIAVNAFGRQKADILNALSDRLNRPDSRGLVYYTNLLRIGEAVDLFRYRAMFWQVLRQSRVSTAFDHFFTDPQTARLSYVGPRWFEALAAGTVVAGVAPQTADRAALLDWEDATIDLSADPAAATDQMLALLADDARLKAASARNLAQMSLRHDWSHRLSDILATEGIAEPASLERYQRRLQDNAARVAQQPLRARA